MNLHFQHALKFGELTKDVMVPRSLPPPPPPPPVPPKTVRIGVMKEIENQQPAVTPVVFTEFKSVFLRYDEVSTKRSNT